MDSMLVPLSVHPQPKEGSSLRSSTESDSNAKLWKHIADHSSKLNAFGQLINQLSRESSNNNKLNVTDLELFPFKIYSLSSVFRPTTDSANYTSSVNWRTVRVRGGLVLTNTVATSSFVNGTDRMQDYSYYNMYGDLTPSSTDIQVPDSSSKYWFWIENAGTPISGSPYILRHGANPTSISSGNPTPWTSFPTANPNYTPIGYVDTLTSSSINRSYVRQILTADVISAPPAGSTVAPAVQMYVITSLSNADWVIGVPILRRSGSINITGSSTLIAKSPRLRPSVISEIIDGTTITYSSYTSDNLRTATDGTNTELQYAFPRYSTSSLGPTLCPPNDLSIIFAMSASYVGLTGSLSPYGILSGSGLVEVSPARVWARPYI